MFNHDSTPIKHPKASGLWSCSFLQIVPHVCWLLRFLTREAARKQAMLGELYQNTHVPVPDIPSNLSGSLGGAPPVDFWETCVGSPWPPWSCLGSLLSRSHYLYHRSLSHKLSIRGLWVYTNRAVKNYHFCDAIKRVCRRRIPHMRREIPLYHRSGGKPHDPTTLHTQTVANPENSMLQPGCSCCWYSC